MKIIGGILAGGRGRRMTGIDKPFASLAGQPLIAHVIARLAPQTDSIVLNANADLARFEQFGLDVVADQIEGYRGPLAGIHTLMQAAQARGASHVLVVPADTPFLPKDLATRLSSSDLDDNTVRIACSYDRTHPVVALWPVCLAAGLAKHLSTTDDLSMAAYLRSIPTAEIDFTQTGKSDPFFNINEPADLDQAERLFAQTDV